MMSHDVTLALRWEMFQHYFEEAPAVQVQEINMHSLFANHLKWATEALLLHITLTWGSNILISNLYFNIMMS